MQAVTTPTNTAKKVPTQLKHSGLCLYKSARSLKWTLLWYTARTDVPCCTIPGHKGYLSARDDSLCVGGYVCIPIYHTQCFRNHTLLCKIVELVAAHCSGCNDVVAKRVRYKMTVTLWDDTGGSDLHVTTTTVVASFRSRDMWIPLTQRDGKHHGSCDSYAGCTAAKQTNQVVGHAYVVIMTLKYALKPAGMCVVLHIVGSLSILLSLQ